MDNIPITKEWLEEQIRLGQSEKNIAKLINCSISTVRRVKKKFNINVIKGSQHKNSYMEITNKWWYRLTRSPHKFNITPQYIWELYLKQNKKCALTGLDIRFPRRGEKADRDGTVSIDRIDNTKGYIRGNIQLVTIRINLMKHVSTQEKFIEMCNRVAKLHPYCNL